MSAQSFRAYDLMVDWEKRLENELPFLFKFLHGEGVQKILEVGCATGRHSIEVARKGIEVVGIDLDPEMIEIAEGRAKKEDLPLKFITVDFLEADKLISEKFDALYSLGNTTALIASNSSYREVFDNFGKCLKPNGILLFHMLNFERERSGWSPPRYVQHGDEEWLFLRRFETLKDLLRIEIVTLRKEISSKGNWDFHSRGSDLPRIRKKEVQKLLLKAGFQEPEFYGDYQSNEFTSEAIDLITTAKKPG